jgi:Sec-independent protein translocase protein TatA
MPENKFENPFPPENEKLEGEQAEQQPEVQVLKADELNKLIEGGLNPEEVEITTIYEQIGETEELSPEQLGELKGEMGDYFEQVKKDMEDLKQKISIEQSDEEKKKMEALLADLEQQAGEWDSDFSPAIDEAEAKATATPVEARFIVRPKKEKK